MIQVGVAKWAALGCGAASFTLFNWFAFDAGSVEIALLLGIFAATLALALTQGNSSEALGGLGAAAFFLANFSLQLRRESMGLDFHPGWGVLLTTAAVGLLVVAVLAESSAADRDANPELKATERRRATGRAARVGS